MEQRQTPRLVRYQYLEGLIDQRVVLELGCGDGAGTDRLNRWAKQVVACEPDSAALARARARLQGGSVEFLTGNATPLPQPDQFFDVVWVPELQRWLGDASIMPELRRVLKAEGVALFAVPAGESGSVQGLAYDALLELLGETFEHVRVVGEIPFWGTTMADFQPDGDELDAALECSLVEEDEAPTDYLAICSDLPLAPQGYAVVQFPSALAPSPGPDADSCRDELELSKRSLARINRQLDEVAAKATEKQRVIERLSLELRTLRSSANTDGEAPTSLLGSPGTSYARDLLRLKRELKQKNALIAQLSSQQGLIGTAEGEPNAVTPEESNTPSSGSPPVETPKPDASAGSLDHLRELLHEERQRSLEAARAVISAEAKALQADALSEALVEARKAAEEQRLRAEGAERRCDILLARIEEGAAELASLHQRWAELQALRQSDRWRIDELLGRLRSLEAGENAAKGEPPNVVEERLEAAQRRISELTVERDRLRVELAKHSGS